MNTPTDRRRFLVLGDREIGRADNGAYCRVHLLRGADVFVGEAGEIDTDLGRARASASATLHAAEQAVGRCRLGLEGLVVKSVFDRPHLIVSVEALAGRRFARLPGIAAVDRSLEDAACAAALDAVERWVAF